MSVAKCLGVAAAAVLAFACPTPAARAQGLSDCWIDSISVIGTSGGAVQFQVTAVGHADDPGWLIDEGGTFQFTYTYYDAMNMGRNGFAIAYWDYDPQDSSYIAATTTFWVADGCTPDQVRFTMAVLDSATGTDHEAVDSNWEGLSSSLAAHAQGQLQGQLQAQGLSDCWIDSVSITSTTNGITYEIVAVGYADGADGWEVDEGGNSWAFTYTYTNIMNDVEELNAIAYWDYDPDDGDYVVAVTSFTVPTGATPGDVWFTFPVTGPLMEQDDVVSRAVGLTTP